ncbi:hypothetical protein PSEUDO8O_30271 [Pseudomonas sp. 8O]|nr:hypothetical protein PSEUDO8O_30271 [Pseudomonas sp. 8O]
MPIGSVAVYNTRGIAHQAIPTAPALSGAVGEWTSVQKVNFRSKKVSIRGMEIASIGCDHMASIR